MAILQNGVKCCFRFVAGLMNITMKMPIAVGFTNHKSFASQLNIWSKLKVLICRKGGGAALKVKAMLYHLFLENGDSEIKLNR